MACPSSSIESNIVRTSSLLFSWGWSGFLLRFPPVSDLAASVTSDLPPPVLYLAVQPAHPSQGRRARDLRLTSSATQPPGQARNGNAGCDAQSHGLLPEDLVLIVVIHGLAKAGRGRPWRKRRRRARSRAGLAERPERLRLRLRLQSSLQSFWAPRVLPADNLTTWQCAR